MSGLKKVLLGALVAMAMAACGPNMTSANEVTDRNRIPPPPPVGATSIILTENGFHNPRQSSGGVQLIKVSDDMLTVTNQGSAMRTFVSSDCPELGTLSFAAGAQTTLTMPAGWLSCRLVETGATGRAEVVTLVRAEEVTR